MQTITMGLRAVPAVMGGMISDENGNVLAHSFPDFFDQGSLQEVAGLIHDNCIGLQDATGGAKFFDVRTELGRIIVKAMPRFFITALCEPTVNFQLLMISMNVAVKKLEKMPYEQPVASAVVTAASAPRPPDEKKIGRSIGPPPVW